MIDPGVEVGYWTHALIEVAIILGAHWCPEWGRCKQIVEYLLPHGQVFLSPATVVAAVLGATAGAIRYQSFRELGRHFTYHITIMKDHKLITTGPYALVRHPGYMGWTFLYPAMAIYYMAPGSWFRETGMYARKEGWLLILPMFIASVALMELAVRRSNAEDELLKKEFGKEWERWADRVRYKFVPGLY
ncbi:Delta(14)-sterol reductase [Psilocybe cubensis]|uniref:Delta(14)-sterol reductase n=2 Tax=Psilocybe cubensis TaxID=181762 RepID=A0ACB8GHA7_PSICU|nr:Delta(14)-sterol reductase [Psilocybe cubensis]KAH9474825.1 Delta(14)-sterol reductase [Psilocybe cubensis]